MQRTFPLLKDAHPDDPHGAEYCFYTNVIDVTFAGSVGEEGVVTAWKIADKYGLRVLVGDELLPRAAPTGERNFHISVLDGRKPSKDGIKPNIAFVVFDPQLTSSSSNDIKQWTLDQLALANWSADSSILGGDLLKQWNGEFTRFGLGSMSIEAKFFREFIFIRIDKKDVSTMVSATMKLSHKLHLPLFFFENLASQG
jgi:hypothetical protein